MEEAIRIPCPICGERDRREFHYLGSRDYLLRPEDDVWSAGWDVYLHQRMNAAGNIVDLWRHEAGCGAWLLVERNTVNHEIAAASLVFAAGL